VWIKERRIWRAVVPVEGGPRGATYRGSKNFENNLGGEWTRTVTMERRNDQWPSLFDDGGGPLMGWNRGGPPQLAEGTVIANNGLTNLG